MYRVPNAGLTDHRIHMYYTFAFLPKRVLNESNGFEREYCTVWLCAAWHPCSLIRHSSVIWVGCILQSIAYRHSGAENRHHHAAAAAEHQVEMIIAKARTRARTPERGVRLCFVCTYGLCLPFAEALGQTHRHQPALVIPSVSWNNDCGRRAQLLIFNLISFR